MIIDPFSTLGCLARHLANLEFCTLYCTAKQLAAVVITPAALLVVVALVLVVLTAVAVVFALAVVIIRRSTCCCLVLDTTKTCLYGTFIRNLSVHVSNILWTTDIPHDLIILFI